MSGFKEGEVRIEESRTGNCWKLTHLPTRAVVLQGKKGGNRERALSQLRQRAEAIKALRGGVS